MKTLSHKGIKGLFQGSRISLIQGLLFRRGLLIIVIILLGILVSTSSAISVSKVPIDTEQKLKAYANDNLKEHVKYSSFEILEIAKFDDFVVIHFKADGKEHRWFKTTKSFDKLTK